MPINTGEAAKRQRTRPTKTKAVDEKPVDKEQEAIDLKRNRAKAASEVAAKATQGHLGQLPVAFTRDSRLFINSTDKEVRFFSVATGQAIRAVPHLPEDRHGKPLTAAVINYASPDQLITSSFDKRVKVWNYEEQTLLKTFKFEDPVHNICLCPARPDEILVLTFNSYTGTSSVYLHKLSEELSESAEPLTQIPSRCRMAWSPDGSTIALVHERVLHLGTLHNNNTIQMKRVTFKSRATCLAFHPTEASLAIGDVSGQVTLWYYTQPMQPNEQMASTSFHWHALAVRTIAFTSDGIHMLSGGVEGVLVIWHLRSATKQFLPHLGADINSVAVSPDQSSYAIAQQSNSVRIINALDLTQKQVVQGLKINASDKMRLLSGSIAIEPRTGNLVLNGSAGSLQFYNPITNRHILDLEVTPVSHLARVAKRQSSAIRNTPSNRQNIYEPVVDHVAFTSDGRWMITADSRIGSQTLSEQFLKFWAFDTKKQSYQLRTRVDAPHQDMITSISTTVRHNIPLVVTTGKDGRWKAWGLQTDNKTKYWTCVSSCDYRGMQPLWSALSDDGSVLAVAFDSTITLWDPWYATLKHVFSYSINQRHIQQLDFIATTPYLVATTDQHLYVWNLLTCSVQWCIQMKVQQLAIDPNSTQFSVIGSTATLPGKFLFIFDPRQSVPKSIEPTFGRAIIYAGATPARTSGVSPLVLLDHHNELYVRLFDEPKDSTTTTINEMKDVELSAATSDTGKGLFTNLFGKTEQSTPASTGNVGMFTGPESAAVSSSMENSDECWSLPSHVMPGVHTIYTHFMSNLLSVSDNKHTSSTSASDEHATTKETATATDAPLTTFMVVSNQYDKI
ncbi:WD40-repeat-containing domain protein [Syncephalis plumigaleata]|nr:WD40-repeat-containing domain protein [Syncephalis plumigaleata]